jgi:hypothetical protein
MRFKGFSGILCLKKWRECDQIHNFPDCHRDALALTFYQTFNIFSAFHFFDLHFSSITSLLET